MDFVFIEGDVEEGVFVVGVKFIVVGEVGLI